MKDKKERWRIFKKSRGIKAFENIDVVLLGLLAPILLTPLIEMKSLELLSLESCRKIEHGSELPGYFHRQPMSQN